MIKLSEPFFFGNEISNLRKILKDKWISSGGKAVKVFEKNLLNLPLEGLIWLQ